MGWLCCGSKSGVIEDKSRQQSIASRKSGGRRGTLPKIVETVKIPEEPKRIQEDPPPPIVKLEPYIPEPSPSKFRYNIRESCLPLVGSPDLLKVLHKIIEENTSVGKMTILAQADPRLGNVSKSDTVRKYISKYGDLYQHILWIDAENRITIQNSFYNLSELLQNNLFEEGEVKRYKPAKSLARETFRVLTRETCLIVYDNVYDDKVLDPMDGIQDFLPSPFIGQISPAVILTSRRSKWDNPDLPVGLELASLTEENCVDYILESLKFEDSRENRATAAEIAKSTQRLPLLLQLAVAIIQQDAENEIEGLKSYHLSEFLENFRSMKRKCLPLRPVNGRSDYRYFVMIHMAMAKVLEHPNASAREIARRCSRLMMYFEVVKVPRKIFALFFPFATPEILNEGLELLSSYFIVTDCGDYFEMHPMVQMAFLEVGQVRKWEDETLHSEIQQLTSYLSSTFAPHDKYYREILACAVQVEDYIKDEYSVDFNLDYAKFLLSKIKFIFFEKSYEISIRIYEFENQVLGPSHRNTLKSQEEVGDALFNLKRYDEALEVYEANYIARQDIGGKASKDALLVAYSLARTLKKQERLHDAIELYSESDVIAGRRKSVVLFDLMSNLRRQTIVARLRLKLKEYEAVVESASEVVELRLRVEGLDNEETLTARLIKGSALMGLQRWDEGVKELKGVVKLGGEILGKEHHLVVNGMRELGKGYVSWGKLPEALKTYKECLEIQFKHFTLDHPAALEIMLELGELLMAMEKWDEALRMYTQAKDFGLAGVGKEHELLKKCTTGIKAASLKGLSS